MIRGKLNELKLGPDGHFLRELLPEPYMCGGSLSYKPRGFRTHDHEGEGGEDIHVHDHCEVFVILQGKGIVQINGTDHTVGTGDILVVEPGEDHHLISDKEDPLVNIWFHTDRKRPDTQRLPEPQPLRKAVVACRDGIVIKDVPTPPLGPGQIRIRTVVSLISRGSESSAASKARRGELQHEQIMGYVCAGEITEVAANMQSRYKVGDRVAGTKWDQASHATENIVPAKTFARIPDGVSYEEAVFAGLAGTGLQAVRRTAIEPGHYCLVSGAGLIGQFAAQFARINGAHVLVSDTFNLRLDIARKCGAEMTVDASLSDLAETVAGFTRGRGLERGIIAIGGDFTAPFNAVLEQMAKSPDGKKAGRICLAGCGRVTLPDVNILGNVDIAGTCACGAGYRDTSWELGGEYTPVYVPWQFDRQLEEILRWMKVGAFRSEPLITHRMPFTRAAEAWNILLDHPEQALGILLTYETP